MKVLIEPIQLNADLQHMVESVKYLNSISSFDEKAKDIIDSLVTESLNLSDQLMNMEIDKLKFEIMWNLRDFEKELDAEPDHQIIRKVDGQLEFTGISHELLTKIENELNKRKNS